MKNKDFELFSFDENTQQEANSDNQITVNQEKFIQVLNKIEQLQNNNTIKLKTLKIIDIVKNNKATI